MKQKKHPQYFSSEPELEVLDKLEVLEALDNLENLSIFL